MMRSFLRRILTNFLRKLIEQLLNKYIKFTEACITILGSRVVKTISMPLRTSSIKLVSLSLTKKIKIGPQFTDKLCKIKAGLQIKEHREDNKI